MLLLGTSILWFKYNILFEGHTIAWHRVEKQKANRLPNENNMWVRNIIRKGWSKGGSFSFLIFYNGTASLIIYPSDQKSTIWKHCSLRSPRCLSVEFICSARWLFHSQKLLYSGLGEKPTVRLTYFK